MRASCLHQPGQHTPKLLTKLEAPRGQNFDGVINRGEDKVPSQQKITVLSTFTPPPPLQKPDPHFLTPNYPLSLERRRDRSYGVEPNKFLPTYCCVISLRLYSVWATLNLLHPHRFSPTHLYVFVNQENANKESVPERSSGTPEDLTLFPCQFCVFLHSLTG